MRDLASVRPGILLGIGLGGFVDGIVFHQILQWHHMVSDYVAATSLAGLEDNTLADGVFHAVTWTITLVGSLAAVKGWRAGEVAPPWGMHVGALLAGWGLFNLLDSEAGRPAADACDRDARRDRRAVGDRREQDAVLVGAARMLDVCRVARIFAPSAVTDAYERRYVVLGRDPSKFWHRLRQPGRGPMLARTVAENC